MIRKIIMFVLLSALMAEALVGCKAKDDGNTHVSPEDQTVITFAYPEYFTTFNKAGYQLLADAFNAENPDLRVELRAISINEWEQMDKDYLDLVLDPEWGIDVFLEKNFRMLLGEEHLRSQLLDLSPLVTPHLGFDLDDFYPLALDVLKQDGNLWGLPAELDLLAMYYNQDLFDQAGVPYPTIHWTRDDFLDTVVALRQGLPEQKITFSGQVDDVVPFIYAHGGVVKKEHEYILTEPRTIEAVRWFADLALVYEVMPLPRWLESYEPELPEGTGLFMDSPGKDEPPDAIRRWGMIGAKAGLAAQAGDAALWSDQLSVRQGSGGWDWDFKWGVLPCPRDEVEPVFNQVFAYFISANTPHPKAVLRWIDFLTRQPPQLKGIPVRRSTAESEQVRRVFADQIGVEAYDACLRAIEEAMPVDYGLYFIAEYYLGQAMLDILENGADVETALTEAQAALKAER